jgi:hypothetical protein
VGCSGDRSLERKGKGRWGGHGGTYSHVREKEGGGPGHVHTEEGKERGSEHGSAWSGGDGGTQPSGAGGSPRVAVPGHAREREGKGERELAGGPHLSAREVERERGRALTSGCRRRVGPVSNGFKNNPNLIQMCPNLIQSK